MSSRGSSRTLRMVCLTGFMGSGKSTVGRLLARQVGWRFVDLDELIETRARLEIPEIFNRFGETVFREMESQAFFHVLGESGERGLPTVQALGGGTFAQPGCAERLKALSIPVIWLQCSPQLLLERCATMVNRPLFRDEASFRQLYEQRVPFYEQADYRVEAESTPAIVVEKIMATGIFERAFA